MTSRAQVRRLLSLVPYLREHDGVAMTDVAAAFGISLKTLREDLSVLWMCGMPGLTPGDLIEIDMDAVDGEGVIHLSNADYLTRPLRLSTDEALALVLALRTLREIAGPGKRDAVDRAMKKLEAVAGNVPATDQASVAITAARDDIQARVMTGCNAGSDWTSPTMSPRGRRPPDAWSTHCGYSSWRGMATSRLGATPPTRSAHFALIGSPL